MNEQVKYSSRSARESASSEDLKLPSLSCGLSSDEVELSRQKFGRNTLTTKKQAGFWQQFIKNLNDPIIKILICALIINTALMFSDMNWAETIGIAATVFISAFVTTLSEHSSGSAFEKLYSALTDTSCTILRNGVSESHMISEIVRYDLVYLYPGDMVPADGILVRGTVFCNESPLTGESREVRKSADGCTIRSGASIPKDNIFRGSHVVSGNGIMLVTKVGDSTMYGAIANELADDTAVSPLKERLSKLARTISVIGYISAAIVAVVHLADAFWFDTGMNPEIALSRLRDVRFLASELIKAFTMAISVVVVAVPEGLPMMITVVLSSNMKKMLRAGVLVRRLVGIETAGSIDILFTDKTGTLTTGRLTVSELLTGDNIYTGKASLPTELKNSLRMAAISCSSVFNSTERAINEFLELSNNKAGVPDSDIIPFDSARKYAAARYNGKTYVRGAPEYILPFCTSYVSSAGSREQMTAERRADITKKITSRSIAGGRILLQAECGADDFPGIASSGFSHSIPLVFTALYVIGDELRPEAAGAVKSCKSAGISVVMLTGDNAKTAAGIAMKCGILPDDSAKFRIIDDGSGSLERSLSSQHIPTVIDGPCLRSLDDEALYELLPDIAVISRVTPSDKSRLVRLAKAAGHVTGMTGDGINDAPAIKAADVGFAMGSGTDIAREAGDIVITDDNIASITKAVLFGRTIFRSIRKFIAFQLTMNLSAVGVSVLGPMLGIDSPVTVIQMLWVNIIMDTLGSLAFSGEPPLDEYMESPPVKRDEGILTGRMVREILLTGLYAVALSVFFLVSPSIHHYAGGSQLEHLTLFFAMFIFMGICIAMCVRTERINITANISKNRAFAIIMPAVAAVQLLIIYFGGDIFRCVPLDAKRLMFSAAIAFTVIPADTIRKSICRIIDSK